MLSIREFWLPKDGNSDEEYEDAFAYSADKYCFAVADGASDSSYADLWAKSLVCDFVESPPLLPFLTNDELMRWLKPLQDKWYNSIDWKNLSWNAEAKAKEGAFSSLLGVKFIYDYDYWQAFAVGDSCLFQVRNDKLIAKFPIESADQFNNSPPLLSSNPTKNNGIWDFVKDKNGNFEDGDLFLLSTDALSKWILSQYESDNRPWQELLKLNSNNNFVSFLTELRKSRSIRNDDVTLIIINL